MIVMKKKRMGRPPKIDRNMEITFKRIMNPDHYTLMRLAGEYDLTDGRIAQIVQENKQRALEKLSTDESQKGLART